MTELLTESFCERCGTRYTFELARPAGRRLGRVKVLSRGIRHFVMSDGTSLDEAIAAARSEEELLASSQQLDAFHRTFNFCMSCRQYTCLNCWNEADYSCLTCAPLPVPEPEPESPPASAEPGHPPASPDLAAPWPMADVAQERGEPTTLRAVTDTDTDTDDVSAEAEVARLRLEQILAQLASDDEHEEPGAGSAAADEAVASQEPEPMLAPEPWEPWVAEVLPEVPADEPMAAGEPRATEKALPQAAPGEPLATEAPIALEPTPEAEAEADAVREDEVPAGAGTEPRLHDALGPTPLEPAPAPDYPVPTLPAVPAPAQADPLPPSPPMPPAPAQPVTPTPAWPAPAGPSALDRHLAAAAERRAMALDAAATAVPQTLHPEPASDPQRPTPPGWPQGRAAGILDLLEPVGVVDPQDTPANADAASGAGRNGATPVPAATAGSVQSCQSCGLALSITARFCRRCGTRQG